MDAPDFSDYTKYFIKNQYKKHKGMRTMFCPIVSASGDFGNGYRSGQGQHVKSPRRARSGAGNVDRDTAQTEVRRIYGVQTRPLLGGRAMIHLILKRTESGSQRAQLSTDVSASIAHSAVAALANHMLSLVKFAGFTFDRHPNLLLRLSAWAGRFRPPLTVARKFRLCLHPGGVLRVQSLHLPRERLGSAFSVCAVSLCMTTVKGGKMESSQLLFEVQVYPDKMAILVGNKEIVQRGSGITIQPRGTLEKSLNELGAQSAANVAMEASIWA